MTVEEFEERIAEMVLHELLHGEEVKHLLRHADEADSQLDPSSILRECFYLLALGTWCGLIHAQLRLDLIEEIDVAVSRAVMLRLREIGHWPPEQDDRLVEEWGARRRDFYAAYDDSPSEDRLWSETYSVSAAMVTTRHLQLQGDSALAVDAAIRKVVFGWFATMVNSVHGLRLK